MIMATEPENGSDSSMPPKISLAKHQAEPVPPSAPEPVAPQSGQSGEKPRQEAVPPPQPRLTLKPKPIPVGEEKPESKRKTSRISLDDAIRSQADESEQEARPQAPLPSPIPAPPPAEKVQTSRISLDTVLLSGLDQPGAPKTIKLKRPSEAPTVRAVRPPSETAAIDTAKDSLGKTSQIDIAPPRGDEEDSSPTRRKTIKVKRPTQTAAPKPAMRVGAAAQAPLSEGQPVPEGAGVAAATPARGVGVFFPMVGIAAVLVALALIAVLAAQAFPGLGLSSP